jgi:GDPmannose 4,6-dehydratase
VIDDAYKRPRRWICPAGDASKAKRVVGWEPRTSFAEPVRLMVDADLELLSR